MNEKKTLEIYVLPISGGCFVAQLGLLSEVYCAKKIAKGGKFNGSKDYQPDMCLGSSGGNVSAYVALAADWSDYGIERVSRKLRSEIFIKPLIPKELNFIPKFLFVPFAGTLFKQGRGGELLFESMFTEKIVKKVEIWTGTYDSTNRKTQLFCNLSRGETIINPYSYANDQNLYWSLPLRFLNHNLKDISKIAVASATIPGFVSSQTYDNNKYLDGGVTYPSPLSALSSEIYRAVCNKYHLKNAELFEKDNGEIECHNESEFNSLRYEIDTNLTINKNVEQESSTKLLRLIYFAANQTEELYINEKFNMFFSAFYDYYYMSTLQDRLHAINLLRRICNYDEDKIKRSIFCDMNSEKFAKILQIANNYKHYVMILSPKGIVNISLFNINEEDIINKIKLSRIDYNIDLWYCE